MQALQTTIMQTIIKMVTPASPAYHNPLAFEKVPTRQDVEDLLQPGDIIFSRTNSNLYQSVRQFFGIKYDHVAVVINPRQVIHISPPVIGRLDIAYIVDHKRQPLIIRPHLEDLDKFMLVINNYLGEKYNTSAIAQLGLNQIKAKLKNQETHRFSVYNLKYSRICSDSVLYALIRGSPSLEANLEEEVKNTKFQQLGFFMPDEIAEILLANQAEILLKSKFQIEYTVVDFCSKGGEKVVNAAQKLVDIGSLFSNKLKERVRKHSGPKQTISSALVGMPLPQFSGLQLITLMMSFGSMMGIITLSNSTRFLMLMLNTIMIMGHYQQMKGHFKVNYARL